MSTEPQDNTPANEDEVPDQVIAGHRYDGIQEYDNPMPGWWVWLFIGTIVFSGVYVAGLHFFGFIDSYQDDLAGRRQEIAVTRAAYEQANPTFEADETSLAQFVADEAAADAGKAHYATYCASCHGDAGQGLIGPNLTDDYWIHGGRNTDIFEVLTVGVAAKGMPAWDAVLSGEQRAQVIAFIRTLGGTQPAGAKQPEGELVKTG